MATPLPITESDRSTEGGDRLTFVGHATVRLRLAGITVLTDPVLGRWIGPLRRQVPTEPGEGDSVDLALVSHLHRDHFDLRSLRRLPGRTRLIVPRGAGELASRSGPRQISEIGVGEEVAVGEVTVRAVPAQHDSRRGPWRGGPVAEPLGYVISSPRQRVYFAGDTDLFDGMSGMGDLDLALVPIWGWGPSVGPGHLDPEGAARALTLLRPRLAVPIHWGTFYPLGLRAFRGDPLSRPPAEFLRLAAELAPEVEVRVLQPGSAISLETAEGVR